jgi:hypothetical protein
VLNNEDLHTVNPIWGTDDNVGHGTLMVGTVTYGDLAILLNKGVHVQISHRLESAKILPPGPTLNPRELWGFMTAQGISLAEIKAPERKRIICMPITTGDDLDRGRPSSWSGEIDVLASGYMDNSYRLIIVSTGNVDDPVSWRNYPDDNLTNEIEDPGQAWNALTVGAFTEKTTMIDPMLKNFGPIAETGGLSPFSKTSLNWTTRKWPIKPEIVFEGGNVARGPNDSIFAADDLKLVSTYYRPTVAQFGTFDAISAASAQAAKMGAQIQVEYPDAWPETIRGLIVHSAGWTNTLKKQFLPEKPLKRHFLNLLRICGYGVPNLNRARYCLASSLTLISESKLQPFDRKNGKYVTRDMHVYNLPWPTDVLAELGETPVTMRITLSYFVEPSPGQVGWDERYMYPSHALRFDVNGANETENEFIIRINKQAREEGEQPQTTGASDKWLIGEARNVGSIHSDIWKGTASDLAQSNKIAIYPATGWWRERHHLGRWNKECRYSLIVSIYTFREDIDIYTPVANLIRTPIEIEVKGM